MLSAQSLECTSHRTPTHLRGVEVSGAAMFVIQNDLPVTKLCLIAQS
jgi:hypothetical protein